MPASRGIYETRVARSSKVNRPNRQTRRARGKSDPVDAEAAARAVLSGETTSVAKDDQDLVGMIRALRVARRSAVKMRTQITNQMKALVITAPSELRERLRSMTSDELICAASAMRPGPITTPVAATKLALKGLALRHQLLRTEVTDLDNELERLTSEAAPNLCAMVGVGPDVAGALLVAVGTIPVAFDPKAHSPICAEWLHNLLLPGRPRIVIA